MQTFFFRGKKEEKALLLYKHCLYMYVKEPLVKLIFIGSHFYEKRMNHLEIFSFAWLCVKKQLDDLLPPVLNDSRWEKSYRSIRCEHKNKDFFMFRKFKREKKKNGILWWTLRQEAWKRNCKSNGKSWRSKKGPSAFAEPCVISIHLNTEWITGVNIVACQGKLPEVKKTSHYLVKIFQ